MDERIGKTPRRDSLLPLLSAVARRLVYCTATAVLVIFFVLLVGLTVLAVRAWADAQGVSRLQEAMVLGVAKLAFIGVAAGASGVAAVAVGVVRRLRD